MLIIYSLQLGLPKMPIICDLHLGLVYPPTRKVQNRWGTKRFWLVFLVFQGALQN